MGHKMPFPDLFDVALPTHNRALLLRLVTAFAVGVEGLDQRRLAAGSFQVVAFRAALVLRGFVFQPLAGLVDVMALGAVFDAGGFVVRIVDEDRRCALGIVEGRVVNDGHVVLGPCRDDRHPTLGRPG